MKNYISWVILVLLTASCGDFLEEQSKELKYAVSCEDLNELLVGGAYMKHLTDADNKTSLILKGNNAEYFPWIHVMDDDSEECVKGGIETGIASPRSLIGAFHYWEKDPFNTKGALYDDNVWNRLYQHIGVVNVVLNKADEFKNDPVELRNRVKGESHFLRACYYFLLVNFYAKPYSDISSSADLGVPLKTTSYVEDKKWTRTPVDSVYGQIITDLKVAIDCFAGIPAKSIHRASEAAACLLLSRVYCYMGEWEQVSGLCDRVMKMDYSLIDLSTHPSVTLPRFNSFNSQASPEVIFTQGSCSVYPVFFSGASNCALFFKPSPELMGLYEPTDLRLKAFFLLNTNYQYHMPLKYKPVHLTWMKPSGGMVSDVYLIRLAEAYLNKAEALVMSGKDKEAKVVIQQLREKRFQPGDLNTIDSYTGENLVEFIRNERRRELCFEGHRWFDLRRYAVNPKYPMRKSISHPHYNSPMTTGNVDGILAGHYIQTAYPDGNWVLPIPGYEIEHNEGKMIDNERRDSKYIAL